MNETPLDQSRMLRYLLQGAGIAALAMAAVLVATLGRDTRIHLERFSLWVLPVLFCMVLTAWLGNAGRIWLMCRAVGHPLRYRQAIATTMSMEFGANATPAAVGGSALRLTLLRRAGIPFSTSGSLLATDATIDALVFLLLLPFAAWVVLHEHFLQALPQRTAGGHVLGIAIAIAGLLLASAWLLRLRRVQRALSRLASGSSLGRRYRVAARLRHIRRTLPHGFRQASTTFRFLWQQRRLALLANFGLAVVQNGCRYMVLPVIIWSLGIELNPLPLMAAQGLLFMISLLVVVPGGGGSVELLSAVLLPGFVPSAVVGIVVAMWRMFTYYLYVVGGALVFFYVSRNLERVFPDAEARTG